MSDPANAIMQRINRFALLNDAHDHDDLAAMFTEAGSFARPTEPERPIVGRDAIRAFFRDRPKRKTLHVVSNIVVDLIPDGSAIASSYVLLFTPETLLVGGFKDRLVLEDSHWLFLERRGEVAFSTTMASVPPNQHVIG